MSCQDTEGPESRPFLPSPTKELILYQGIEHEDVSKWTDDIGLRATSRVKIPWDLLVLKTLVES
jgi:hypothetical protein